MSAIGMRVSYQSGPVVGRSGVIVNERRRMSGTPEYLVRFEDGSETWLLASNVKF
jgi:hypothetical protein